MEPENIQAFKDLIERYENISLEEIEKEWKSLNAWRGCIDTGEEIAYELTGFGSQTTCTLCRAVKEYCTKCVYFRKRREDFMFCCNTGRNEKTYNAISNAETPEELLKAFRQRAKHMKKAYSKYLI